MRKSALLVGSNGSWYLRLSTRRLRNSFGSSRPLLVDATVDPVALASAAALVGSGLRDRGRSGNGHRNLLEDDVKGAVCGRRVGAEGGVVGLAQVHRAELVLGSVAVSSLVSAI